MAEQKKLTRNEHDRVIAGVASGLADYFGIDSTLVRILFVIFALAGGPGLLVYIILWIIMPLESSGTPAA